MVLWDSPNIVAKYLFLMSSSYTKFYISVYSSVSFENAQLSSADLRMFFAPGGVYFGVGGAYFL
jgi:hypothetical protein